MLATAQADIVRPDLIASLSTRDDIPTLLNERRLFGCGVEVGVQQGAYSAALLERWDGSHLISVDPWFEDAPEDYLDIANLPQNVQDGYYQVTRARLSQFRSRSSIWRLTSVEAAERIPNFSLDFVYLDARHDYASVLEDLDAWYEKIRPGGIIAGHDYIDGDFDAGVFGVKSAVDDFFRARGLSVFSTADDKPWCSWVVEIPHIPPTREASADGSLRPLSTAELLEHLGIVQVGISTADGSFEFQLSLDRRDYVQADIERELNANRLYLPEASGLLIRALKRGDRFMDIGAQVGYFTFLASTMAGRDGCVLAVEPRPDRFIGLANNMKLNRSTNIVPLHRHIGSTVSVDGDSTSIDELTERYAVDSLKLLRVDLAGGPHAALEGAQATIRRLAIPFILATMVGNEGGNSTESDRRLRQQMHALGYEAFQMHRGGAEHLRPEELISGPHLLLFRHNTAPNI